jgi:hypothetical protein
MKASIYSPFMNNVSKDVVNAQAICVNSFLPMGWTFEQVRVSHGSHPIALSESLERSKDDITLFLDIDAVPTSQEALLYLANSASKGILSGCVQRSNHLNNDNHLYVGPFCMALSKKKYGELGSPSFVETYRGDCGEELSYVWSELCFLWPFQVEQPMWDLVDGFKFGLGTTYGTTGISSSMFYHAFNARDPNTEQRFIAKCNQILEKKVGA